MNTSSSFFRYNSNIKSNNKLSINDVTTFSGRKIEPIKLASKK